jgi:hypothetical protein
MTTISVVQVRLTQAEILSGAQAGLARRLRAISKENRPAHGYDNSANWQLDIEGALSEMAVAKALGRYWGGGSDAREDVGRVQVRSTPRLDGSLILHPGDPDAAPFVLAVGGEGSYRLAGWILGQDGKRREWWRTDTGRPAFFVPQSALRPMEEME